MALFYWATAEEGQPRFSPSPLPKELPGTYAVSSAGAAVLLGDRSRELRGEQVRRPPWAVPRSLRVTPRCLVEEGPGPLRVAEAVPQCCIELTRRRIVAHFAATFIHHKLAAKHDWQVWLQISK